VVNDDPIARLESSAARACLNYLPAWLMASDYTLISLWSLAKMLMINSTDILTAYRRCLDGDENFSMTRAWNGDALHFDSTVARQIRRHHCL